MEARTVAARPDVTLATTAPRVTPTPPRAAKFGEVLSNTVVRSAESAMRMLPGSPMMALAVRGGAASVPLAGPLGGGAASGHGSPEGPLAGSRGPSVGASLAGAAGLGGGLQGAPGAGGEAGSIESSLQQSQDMNLYYLQVQESVNAQNRSFTTLSNVLIAQHDTVKTAIGNIR